MAKAHTLRIDVTSDDGWLVARIQLNPEHTPIELGRIIKPSHDAPLRVEILAAFENAVGLILQSVVMGEIPDASFTSRVVHVLEEGNG